MMEVLLALLGLFLMFAVPVSLILPWLQRRDIQQLREEIERLNLRLERTAAINPQSFIYTPPPAAPADVGPPAVTEPLKEPEPVISQKNEPHILPPLEEQLPMEKDLPVPRGGSFELNFGAKLPVWIGGIALVFAGFYLVKYSIDSGLLGPGMRIILGLLFGGALIGSAYKVGPHAARIGQSLAGAGIAVLYGSLFAAASLHHFISPLTAFLGMSAVTALALVMALRHGAPIALLGMTGGFLTPMLVGSNDGNIPLLLTYLYILFTALFWFIRRQNWWGLSLLLVPFVLLWAGIVLFSMAEAGELFFVSLFLIAVSVTVVKGTHDLPAEQKAGVLDLNLGQISRYLNYAVISFAALMIGFATSSSYYDLLNRSLMGVLTLGTLILAWFDRRTYGFAPVMALLVNIGLLLNMAKPMPFDIISNTAALMFMYGVAASTFMWRTPHALYWGLLNVTSLALLYMAGYFMLYGEPIARIEVLPLISLPFWGTAALLLSGHLLMRCYRIYNASWSTEERRQQLLAVFAAGCTGFFMLGWAIELQREAFSLAIMGEVLALCWLNSKLTVKALRPLAALTAVAFALVLLPQLIFLSELTFHSLFGVTPFGPASIPIMQWPVVQLGLPAVALLLSAWLLRQQRDDRLVMNFEQGAIALLGLMAYYLARHAFHPDQNILGAGTEAGFIERGSITNMLMLFGLACLWSARHWARPAIAAAGAALLFIGLFRLGWFDLITRNPLFNGTQQVGNLTLVNGLALTYLLPVGLLYAAKRVGLPVWLRKVASVSQLVLAFAFISFTIRHAFHGEALSIGITENAETYTYSVAWLLLAIGLLIQGARTADKPLRIASLVLMILTVGKVFLIDADELTGLWRVFSFLGLGLVLLALSWFYNRFIFRRDA